MEAGRKGRGEGKAKAILHVLQTNGQLLVVVQYVQMELVYVIHSVAILVME